MTSIRLVLFNELISVLIGVFLLHILRNTRGAVNQGATSSIWGCQIYTKLVEIYSIIPQDPFKEMDTDTFNIIRNTILKCNLIAL
jgi:hypothetical protein